MFEGFFEYLSQNKDYPSLKTEGTISIAKVNNTYIE